MKTAPPTGPTADTSAAVAQSLGRSANQSAARPTKWTQ